MQREQTRDPEPRQLLSDLPTGNDAFDQQRAEIEGLLSAADRVFDSIDSVQAQQYLEQNQQTGGQ